MLEGLRIEFPSWETGEVVQAFDQSVAWMGLCGVSGYIQLGGEGKTQNLRDRLYISSGLEHFAVLPGDPKVFL